MFKSFNLVALGIQITSLQKDFAKEEADRKEREAKQTSIGIPFDEEIPF